ncbi:GntR family transcriptional regulator [Tropicimonas sp. IMCC34043]|uniref:GntR family transcriptional regulator n=1 Tax=Tropicimonas sp. IMCC34043 TaxID=2248760 RepID=UPI000E2851BD|nr:GntR family transcriptional regulator [Tropicimonas sp. IMCC34043]
MQLESPPATTLSASIQSVIESDIVDGRLRPGDKLDEVMLAERLSTSRTPVREALRALASIGLVNIRPRVGATVARPSVSEVLEMFEVVAEMEAVAVRLACGRANAGDRTRIVQLHELCQEKAQKGTAQEYFDANNGFHGAIWHASGNQTLETEIFRINRRLSPYRRVITFNPGRTQTAMAEHLTIINAIRGNDAEAAATAMRDHVSILSEDVISLAHNLRL